MYLRTRGVPFVVCGLAGVGLLAFLVARILLRGGHGSQDSLLPVILWAPIAASTTISLVLTSPMLEIEQGAPRRMGAYTIVVLLGLIALAIAFLIPAGVIGGRFYGLGGLARNVVGLVGGVLMAAPLVGGRLAWTVPVGFGLLVNGVAPHEGPDRALWAWPLLPADDAVASAIALGIFALGIASLIRWHWAAHRVPEW